MMDVAAITESVSIWR